MPKLNVDQKTVLQLFSDKNADFLIPDYQRPYAWEETECATLWNDIYSFALPDNDYEKFNSDSLYFLGPIVIFKNERNKLEVIDGQQRLVTLMLLLRAFHEAYGSASKDEKSRNTKRNIEQCLWKTDEFDKPDMSKLKIDSEVATETLKGEFKKILLTGDAPDTLKSRYAQNYEFFQGKIKELLQNAPVHFPYMATRILKNCILLPIEAESQDTALMIFSTLNDRGKPLSDADIFKAQLYKAFASEGEEARDNFISQWKNLEAICEKIFQVKNGSPMDELFTRYMYYERAKKGIRNVTTEALRKFYEADNYKLLREENKKTFNNLISLANFWNDIANQDRTKFSDRVLRRLFVLNYAPNSMWTDFVSVYFMHNKDNNDCLDDSRFYDFLSKITAFIWAYTIISPGVNGLRTPVFIEMANIVYGEKINFNGFKFNIKDLRMMLNRFSFTNNRPITRAMLAWYAFCDEKQELIPVEIILEIEHIYARNRLPQPGNVESLGNKSLLEKKINIRAADYRFVDKKKYYLGLVPKKPKTHIHELIELANTNNDFTEADIDKRNNLIIESFIKFVRENDLIR